MRAPHPREGWPFWWRWVVWTNVGWFAGIGLGSVVTSGLSSGAAAVLTAAVSAVFFGATQAWALRGVVMPAWHWALACVLGWTLGVALARWLIDSVWRASLEPLVDVIVVATLAGAVIGVAQAPLLRGVVPRIAAWPWISALGWGVLFPGALPGAALVWLARRRHE